MSKKGLCLIITFFILSLTSCGKQEKLEVKKSSVDRTIKDPYESISVNTVKVSANGTIGYIRPGNNLEPHETSYEMAVRSGNDANGDGKLTPADFDVTDNAGFNIEDSPVFTEDIIYNPEDTESDSWSDMITITGIEESGKHVFMRRIEFLDGSERIGYEKDGDVFAARAISDSYVIGVSDTENFSTEYSEYQGLGLKAKIYYEASRLAESGIYDPDQIRLFYISPDKSWYSIIENTTLNQDEHYLGFVPSGPGAYVLGVPGDEKFVRDDEEEDGEIKEETDATLEEAEENAGEKTEKSEEDGQ